MFLYGFSSCTCLYERLSIFSWIFFMYIFVRMTIHFFLIDFRHVQVCTNDYPFLLNGFSSCPCWYEWISNSLCLDCRHLHFCTNDYHFFLNWLSSFTFLYKWLPFLFEWIVVIYISVRMTTISLYMGFRHAHSMQMTFHILVYWFSSMHVLCKWLSIFFWFSKISFWIDFRHVHFCTND